MNEQKLKKLLCEYAANIELWKHDDNNRIQRNGIFLSVNTLLLIALGILITVRQSLWGSLIITGLISIFGLTICIMWYYILLRNGEYVRFRRYQLRDIESQLEDITTISNQWKALNEYAPVSFSNIEDKFILKPSAKQSVTVVEGKLPLIITVFWLFVLLTTIIIIIIHLTGYL